MSITYNYSDVVSGQLGEASQPNNLADDDLLLEENFHGDSILFEITETFDNGADKTVTLDTPPGNFTWANKSILYIAHGDNSSLQNFDQDDAHFGNASPTTTNEFSYKYTSGTTSIVFGNVLGIGKLTTTGSDNILFEDSGGNEYIGLKTNGANLELFMENTSGGANGVTAYIRLWIMSSRPAISI